jgi:flagellar biosynthetic protein FliR
VFLVIGGHHEMLRGVRDSFLSFELLSLGVNENLFDSLIGFFTAATTLAIRLAAPMLVTMLVVDLALGLIGKIMPQMNVMAMGLSLRSALGLVIVILGLSMTNDGLRTNLMQAMGAVRQAWVTG